MNEAPPLADSQPRWLDFVERWGNRLPDPFMLFVGLAAGTLILSAIGSALGWSATMTYTPQGGAEPIEKTVAVRSLLTISFLREVLREFVNIYVAFPPLGITVVVMLAVGFAEQTGLFSAAMRRTLLGAPPYVATLMLALVGANSSLGSVAGVILTTTVAAPLFLALGRNPWTGIFAGYAAASGGYAANLLVSGTDALLSGITASAAKGLATAQSVNPAMDWYFRIAATLMVVVVVTWVTERIVAPRLPAPVPDAGTGAGVDQFALTGDEKRGLRWALWALVVFAVLLLVATIPASGALRSPAGNLVPDSPLLLGIVAIIFLFFFAVGAAYGVGARVIKASGDVAVLMAGGLKGTLSFLAVALPAALAIYCFGKSELATVTAIEGAQLIKRANLPGLPLLVSFVFLVALLNLFMPSGSAKWLILAPVFVPMFAMAGLSPGTTQVSFRIGDSATNIISPIKSYLPVIIGLMMQYRHHAGRKVGIGTLIAFELPYALMLLGGFLVLLVIWYAFELSFGPGMGVRL